MASSCSDRSSIAISVPVVGQQRARPGRLIELLDRSLHRRLPDRSSGPVAVPARRARGNTSRVRPGSPGRQHGEDILRHVDVEPQLGMLDHGDRHVRLGRRLQVLAVGIGAEPGLDGARRTPHQQVRAGLVHRGRDHHGPERVDRARERRGRDERRIGQQDGERVELPPGRLRLGLTDGLQERRRLLAHRLGAPAGGDLQHGFVRRDDPALPSGEQRGGVQDVLEHRERERGTLQRREDRPEPGLRLVERLHGQDDRAHASPA